MLPCTKQLLHVVRHTELAQDPPSSHQPDLPDILGGAPALLAMLSWPGRAVTVHLAAHSCYAHLGEGEHT